MNRNKSIAATAAIAAMVMIGLGITRLEIWAFASILILVACVYWYRSGIKDAWEPKGVVPGRVYRYYGCANHQQFEKGKLLLGSLKTRITKYGNSYYENIQSSRHYKPGIFSIDVVTDALVVGEKYKARSFMKNDKPVVTLNRIV